MREMRGLYLVGSYQGVAPAQRGDGSTVPGMFKLSVDVAREGGRPWPRDAVFFDMDQETGEPTSVARVLEDDEPDIGSLVAVKVAATTTEGSKYVNMRAVGLLSLAAFIPA